MSRETKIAVPAPEDYGHYFETLSALGASPISVGADVNPEDFDGLLLPGGIDIDPARYHQPNVACERIDPALDARQFGALDAFVRARKPVFGICRGHQLINVYFGGTLIQNLPQCPTHKWDSVTDADRAHGSRAELGSWLCELYGPLFPVNSAHHQGVDRVGEGLRAVQWADDGVIEALRHESLPVCCVQWHPERMCLERARADAVDGSVVLRHFLRSCGQSN